MAVKSFIVHAPVENGETKIKVKSKEIFTKSVIYGRKKFYSTGPWLQTPVQKSELGVF